MTRPFPGDLAQRWFDHVRRSAGTRDERKALSLGQPEPVQAAADLVEDVVVGGGAAAVDLIDVLARAAPGVDQVIAVAAGPIESFIYEHGDAAVDQLVVRARSSPTLRRALGYVSLATDSVSVASTQKLARFSAARRKAQPRCCRSVPVSKNESR